VHHNIAYIYRGISHVHQEGDDHLTKGKVETIVLLVSPLSEGRNQLIVNHLITDVAEHKNPRLSIKTFIYQCGI